LRLKLTADIVVVACSWVDLRCLERTDLVTRSSRPTFVASTTAETCRSPSNTLLSATKSRGRSAHIVVRCIASSTITI